VLPQEKVDNNRLSKVLVGCLVGTAVGDALGLPCEGMSRQRQQRMFPQLDGHRFIFRRGMCSDDTEHTCMVAQALIVSRAEPETFARNLSWRFRFWLLGLPAGVGFATLRAILKSWIGFPPDRSGVWSAGNGPAMRSAIIGVAYAHDLPRMQELVRVSSRLTHIDPRAEVGALAVAVAAALASRASEHDILPTEFLETLQSLTPATAAPDLVDRIKQAVQAAEAGISVQEFADSQGLQRGVSGFINHTVPVAIHAWLTHQHEYRAGILETIRCGGDTDTTAAIVGALIGTRVRMDGIPLEWITGLAEYPRNIPWLQRLGNNLAGIHDGQPVSPLSLNLPALVLRNLLFFLIVLAHCFRRLLPPY